MLIIRAAFCYYWDDAAFGGGFLLFLFEFAGAKGIGWVNCT